MKRIKKNIDGILLLDKPEGLSSNQALQRVKHLFQAAKAGHTGSLDPMATGVLPLCFGEATKFSHYGLEADKTYEAFVKLGETTTTGDREGDVTSIRPVLGITSEKLKEVQKQFTGALKQIPPMYSALKKDGVPLYRLARQGQEIERVERDVTIFELKLEQIEPSVIKLFVNCSKGTYVRTLAEDIGEKLGCGAHLIMLRRLMVGQLSQPLWTLEQLQQCNEIDLLQCLLPADALVKNLPLIILNEVQQDKLFKGQQVLLEENTLQGIVKAYNHSQQFLGLVEIENNILRAKRLINLNR